MTYLVKDSVWLTEMEALPALVVRHEQGLLRGIIGNKGLQSVCNWIKLDRQKQGIGHVQLGNCKIEWPNQNK